MSASTHRSSAIRTQHGRALLVIAVLLSGVLIGMALLPAWTRAAAPDPVTAAWQRAKAAGNYRFTSDITQVTLPLATVANVGHTSRTDQLHLEGQNDLRARQMAFTLWSDGGNVLQAESGVSVRMEDGQTYARRGAGAWEIVDDMAGAIAPQGDFMSFLAAVKDVTAQPAEQRGGITFTRYTFQIDSPRLALYLHEQTVAALRARGELPNGIHLEAPTYFRDMAGSGELWVGDDGLPLRQILTLEFPPQKDEQVHAQIVVNFSSFGNAQLAAILPAAAAGGAFSLATLAAWSDYGVPAAMLLGLLALTTVLLYYRRARALQATVVGVVIFAQVAGPLFTTDTNMRFFAAQAAQAADQEERRARADEDRELRDVLGTVDFNPHVSPLERDESRDWRLETGNAPVESNLQSPISSLQSAPALQTTDTGLDTDGDGLTDFAEERIGTSLATADTDGDGLRDNVEVNGFAFGGQTWYTNPDATDSNGDGLGDIVEWGVDASGSLRATPFDTDGDGIPDLFDADNDGDGVPDHKDLAPFARGATVHNANTPLQLTIKNLTAGKPTFIEFQLRPQDEKQLWFAYNVLDWPRDDVGQVRDVDARSYADLATAAGRTTEASEANGDMKVLPMLEIRIPADSANLPAQDELTPFNISVNDFTADGQTKVAYIPLNIVTDDKSGQRVAFSGQMRYLPTGSWLTPHQVRLAWVVQALVDMPCDKAVDTSPDCQADGYRNNVPQMLQTYYGDWTLTGMNVREEHGTDMAIIFEDPAVDDNVKDDAALWALAHVFDQHFVIGRDAGNDGVRDVQVANLAARFDRDNNPTDAQRMDVPNILQVVTRSYATLDAALASTTMTETAAILDTVFKPLVANDRQIKPLLFFAQENRGRYLTLDLSTAGQGYAAFNGAALTFDLAPGAAPALTVDVNAGMKWMGYCAPATGAVTLSPCSDDDYWATLESRYAALAPQPDDEEAGWVGARVMLAQLFFTGMRSGFYANVQAGAQVLSQFGLETESQTALAVRAARQGAATAPLLAAQSFYRLFPGYVPGDAPQIQKKATLGYAGILREGLKEAKEDLADKISTGSGKGTSAEDYAKALTRAKARLSRAKYLVFRFGAAIAGAAGAVLMVSLQIASLVPNLPNQTRLILGAFSTALNIMINVVAPIVDLVRSIIQSPLSAARVLSFVGKSYAVVQRGAAVGAVLSAVLIWGFFIYGAATSGLAAGNPTLNRLFFETVAATIVTVLMAVLTANPIGAIVSAILGAIDAILSLICELGVAELRQAPTLDGACFTLTGALTKVLTKLLYSYDLMIDMGRSDLMVTGAPDVVLGDPGKGFVAGNTLSVTLPVTTTAVHKDPDPNNGVLIYPYMYLFSADNLRRSSFLYSLTSGAEQALAVALDQMKALWQNVGVDHTYLVSPMYRGELSSTPPAVTGQTLTAGINRPVPLMLNMSYAVPAYECWTLIVIPICYTREYKGDNHMPIDSLHYDVFPASLNEFLAMSAKGDGGLGLSWDARFPSLRDADGDGLLSTAYNGLDPNDAAADADGDGLTDRFELDRRAAGVNISPVLRDTDNDGLPDAQELRLGTNPAAADSDNDGLTDGEEVAHLVINPDTGAPTTTWAGGWNVTINALTPFTVRVSSDPLSADGDNDGVNDLAERQLALDPNPANRVDSQNRPYHPAVPNSPPLAVVVESDDFDGYVAPGQSFLYTSTVIANAAMAPGVLNVDAPAILGGARGPLLAPFDTQTFSVTQAVAQGISVTVASGLGTQQTAISTIASTRLADTGPAAWGFTSVTTEPPLGGIIAPNLPYYSAVTASRPDRQDNYHVAAMAFDNLNSPVLSPIGRGDILAYTLPAGTVRAIENDANNTRAFMGATAPSMATNTAGDTFAAWGQQRYCNTVTFNSIRVTTAGADGQDASPGIEPIIALTPNGGTESFAWRWDTGGGSMTGGQQRGPGANGFPVSAEFCNGAVTFRVYDNDGAANELVASQSVFMYTPVNGDVTFTGAGHTIVVNMTIPVIDRFVIAGALLGPDGQVKRSITFPRSPVSINALRGSFGPAVASDGDGFLVAYESYAETAPATPGSPQIVVQAFDKDGNPLQSSYQAAGSAQASDPQYSSIALDAAWIGYAYRVVWQDRRAAQVRAIDVVRDGSSMSGPLQLFGNALTNAGINYGPSVAYDPLTGRVLTVFLSDVRRVIGILQNGGAVIGNPLVLSLDQFPSARSPQVAWHPGYRGWLVSYQDETASQRHLFVPVNADGVQAFPAASGFFIAANDNSLACPAPQSAPAVELRFEELPGAATFADASGRANNATCTGATCPLAGLAGAPNAPLSDYAAQFDGVDDGLTIARTIQDNFSVAFWIKAPPSTGQRTIVDGGNIASNGFAIRLNSGGVSVYVPGVSFQTIQRVDDDQWHFVVVSRNNASGQVDIYIDGALARGLPGTPGVALTNAATLRIGVKPDGTLPLRATLDHLQIIPAALAADTVLAMYNRTLQSYCVAAGTRDSNVYWARVQATQPDVRGGRVSASNGLHLTIDADLPTAQFAALQNGAIVGPGQVIGGSASDPTSGVGLVEVSINNGAWQPATGADAWAFSLAGQSGAISLRVRATDRVGNVGAASAPLNLVVDTVAPVVSVVVPPATLKPTKNAEGRWQINLSGAASDASGVNPASLLVRLEQQSGVGMAQSVQQAALNGANWSIGYLLNAGLYDPTGAYTVTVQAADSVGNQATPAIAVLRLDARGPEATLSASDTARQAISQTLTIGGVLVDTDSNAGVNTLEIAFTPVEQIAALPAGLTSAQAEAQLNRVWAPVNLAQRGPGVATTTWSYPIPAGLENLYQIDLRATDMLGNVALNTNLWRGMIDTTDPRVVMTATPTGASYLDAGGQRRQAIRYLCAAVDRNLDAASFVCPGAGLAEPTRSFAVIPELQAIFPDLTIRNGLALSYTLWVAGASAPTVARACDTLGRCAQASAPEIRSVDNPPTASVTPQALVVAPTAGAIVAAGNLVSITVAAEAAALLKEVVIRVDGVVVQTVSFAESDAVTQVQRTVSVMIANEGPHTVEAQATDWSGAAQTAGFPVDFTLDTTPPTVTIDASALTPADTWAPQSGMLRFNGAASDAVGLSAVQVRVDDGAFVDATFGNGTWQTAVYAPDPEGRTLAVTVRAIDRAGRVTEITQAIEAALSAEDAPDTAITGGPTTPSGANRSDFTFIGSASAVVFECQLDGSLFQPCASPQQYADLSKGDHIFRVRAVDSRGFVDLSPATFAWTVVAGALDVTLNEQPASSTTERSATFAFTGSADAATFECALDDGLYAQCTSPQRYAGLRDGEHLFRVRARDAANVAGAATRHVWRVVNAPPQANDQRVTTATNQATGITLTATDNEPVSFAVVLPPAHGVLTGLAPNLIYTPDTNYVGADSFTFRASDGQGAEGVGVVTISVGEQPGGVTTPLYLPIVQR